LPVDESVCIEDILFLISTGKESKGKFSTPEYEKN
jgi:hypothetical protein